MNKKVQKITAGLVAAMMVGTMSASVLFAADNAFGIDEINWTEQDWNSIAVTNDDTVETGAVIRVNADSDSDAAGFLYRGSAAHIINKGDEWTEVKSGKVTGFVKNEYLAFGDDARGLAAHYGKQGIVANWDDVNVFSKSDADSDVSGQISNGKKMSMIEDYGHWVMVQSGKDSVGFVSEEDVSRVLLMDTAVPASGEDEEDVLADMTSEDVPAATYAEVSSSEPQMYEGTTVSNDEGSYTEETSAPEYYEDTTVSYTEETTAAYTEETAADYTVSAASETTGTQIVSDNATIQAAYENYMNAYNAAMSCTSAEDAQTKADAARAAYNEYLTACGESTVSVSSTTTTSTDTTNTTAASDTQTTDTTAYQTTDTTTYQTEAPQTEAPQAETAQAETVQTEAAQTASSSGSNAYGSYSDLDLLAAIIWCEAGNQPYDGMVAVGQVVMNRVYSSSYPNTVSEVLNQPGQFTPASSGTLQAALASGVNSTCYQAAQDAMNGATPVEGTPMYFNTHSGTTKLGAHYFS